jgi:membrane fusion protein (multidrug efflux system)
MPQRMPFVQSRDRQRRASTSAALLALLLPVGIAGVAACGESKATASGGSPAGGGPPPAEVSVVTVEPQSLPLRYEFVGEVQPIRRVEVRARVDGVIESRPFTEGTLVKTGDVLYRLERVRSDAAFRSASARVANAKRTLARLEPLVARNAVAQQDLDNARTELESAEAALDEARKNREDAVVRAEMSGRVGRTLLEVGARVTGPGDLLTTIEQLDPVYVTFRPSSQILLNWQRDPGARALTQRGSKLKVRVVLPDGTELPREGKLDYVSPSLDPGTGTQEFRAAFANRDLALVPGQYVRVRLEGFTRDGALAVPQRAVQQSLGKQFVLVVGKGDTVAARDVVPGPWSGEQWIIENGLAAGDRVIVDGGQKARPGGPVRPVPLADSAAAMTAAATAAAPGAPAPQSGGTR